jgi:hypothetical protein
VAQYDRLFPHIRGNEIAGIGDLAFVAEIKPTTGEETLAFQLVDLTVGKNATVYETGFWIDKRLDLHSVTPLVFTFQ